jgi:dTDP-D-glucose 4,6-dehydratase
MTYPNAYNIVSFDKLDYCASLNNTRALNDKRNFSFYHGDITNPSEVMDCLERYKIDTIFHFAAQSHVDLSFGNSYTFTYNNVFGTHVLLESAKKVGIKKFIHISTGQYTFITKRIPIENRGGLKLVGLDYRTYARRTNVSR